MDCQMFYVLGTMFEPSITQDSNSLFYGSAKAFQDEFHRHFFGLIKYNNLSFDNYGIIKDSYGNSYLSDIKIEENSFSFSKKYENRNDTIQYHFQKKELNWVGYYFGNFVGHGFAVCKIIPYENVFYDLEKIKHQLFK
jgi:hypothetical protein